MNINVPVDGRMQFEPATVKVTNAVAGRWLTAGVETVTPGGKYILKNSWPPAPRASGGGGFSSAVAATQAAPDAGPRSGAAARAVWPNLK